MCAHVYEEQGRVPTPLLCRAVLRLPIENSTHLMTEALDVSALREDHAGEEEVLHSLVISRCCHHKGVLPGKDPNLSLQI